MQASGEQKGGTACLCPHGPMPARKEWTFGGNFGFGMNDANAAVTSTQIGFIAILSR